MEFKKGDRVVLTTGRHGKSNKNPVWGSKYQCAGTIPNVAKSRFATLFPIRVDWDNGLSNAYDHPDLSLKSSEDSSKDNPNFTFRRKKNDNY